MNKYISKFEATNWIFIISMSGFYPILLIENNIVFHISSVFIALRGTHQLFHNFGSSLGILDIQELLGDKRGKWDHNSLGFLKYNTPKNEYLYSTNSTKHLALLK